MTSRPYRIAIPDAALHDLHDRLKRARWLASLDAENRLRPLTFAPGERITPPLGVALFPRELPMPPRSWIERVFQVTRWSPMPTGGHFAALEQPTMLANDIRAFFRPLRVA